MQALLLAETPVHPAAAVSGDGPAARRCRREPRRDAAYAALSLPEVSALRAMLLEHETRTAYWLRAMRSRRASVGGAAAAGGADLSRPLGAAARALEEIARLDVRAVSGEPLPDLVELWTRAVPPSDETGCRRLRRDLEGAIARLEQHEVDLRGRRTAAAAELVARYREEPALALLALPTTTGGRRPW